MDRAWPLGTNGRHAPPDRRHRWLCTAVAWEATTMSLTCEPQCCRYPSSNCDAPRLRGTSSGRSTSTPDDLDGATVGLLVLAGAANLGGLLLVVTALREVRSRVVAPIVSTEGAIAAVLAILAGESVSPGPASPSRSSRPGSCSRGAGTEEVSRGETTTRAPRVPLPPRGRGGAFSFGVSLYATGQVSDDAWTPWALLPARVIGVVVSPCPCCSQ